MRPPSTTCSSRSGPLLPLRGVDARTFRGTWRRRRCSSMPPSSTGPHYRRWASKRRPSTSRTPPGGLARWETRRAAASPLTFVVSTRLGPARHHEAPSAWLDHYPGPAVQTHVTADWSVQLIAELAATGAVDSVDFKGQYRGTAVDTVPDPGLYERVGRGSPTPGSRIRRSRPRRRPCSSPTAGASPGTR